MFLAGKVNGDIFAVGIANRTGEVDGLFNVFARSTANIDIRPGIIAKTTELFPTCRSSDTNEEPIFQMHSSADVR